MANAVKGEAVIKVGGQDYTLVFTANALCEVEYILDKSTEQILLALTRSPPIHVIRALLWGGLRKYHPDADLIACGDLIEEMGGSAAALQMVGKALSAGLPEPAGDDPGRPRKGARAGTGPRS